MYYMLRRPKKEYVGEIPVAVNLRAQPLDWPTENTGMVEKGDPRLRDPTTWLPLAGGASSRNLHMTSLFDHACTTISRFLGT